MLSTLKDMVAGNEVILPEYNYKTNSRFVLPYMIMLNINYSKFTGNYFGNKVMTKVLSEDLGQNYT